jgi:hypothetical protein
MPIELKLAVYGQYKGKKFAEPLVNFMQFRKFIGDWTPALRFIAHDVLEAFVEKQFESEGAEGAEGGLAWQELAESTLRGGKAESRLILYETGHLLHSFLEGGEDHVEEISPKELRWGSAVPYSLFHQTGAGKGFGRDRVPTGPGTGRGMPRRRELRVSKAMTNDMMLAFQARSIQVARQVGFGVARRAGERGISALEARRIGENILGVS